MVRVEIRCTWPAPNDVGCMFRFGLNSVSKYSVTGQIHRCGHFCSHIPWWDPRWVELDCPAGGWEGELDCPAGGWEGALPSEINITHNQFFAP